MRLSNIALFITLFSAPAYSQGCTDYPFTNGMNIEEVEGGVKIIATASVGVSFDDVDALNDARDEATTAAKVLITRFMQEEIRDETAVSRAVRETRSMQGETRQAQRNEVIQRVRNMSGSSAGMLRGVVPLGECYTPGREMRVSVGIKPETTSAAGGLAGQMGQSRPPFARDEIQPAPAGNAATGQGAATQGGTPLNRVPGFSNTERLNRF